MGADRFFYFCHVQYKLAEAATERERRDLEDLVQRLHEA